MQTSRKIKILRFDNGTEYFCNCTAMKALRDTSQFERLHNRMGW